MQIGENPTRAQLTAHVRQTNSKFLPQEFLIQLNDLSSFHTATNVLTPVN
jgi:hypothetical protein